MSNREDLPSFSKDGHLYLTLNGKSIVSFRYDSTKHGGISLGPSIKGSDIHLTFWEEKDKFRYHIRHKGIKEPADESPLGAQKSTKLVLNNIGKMLRNRVRKYHSNSVCWVFTNPRWKKIQSMLPQVDLTGDIYVPLEVYRAQFDMDFLNKDLWRKVKIYELLTHEPYFGFKEMREGFRIVKPISPDHMLVWPLSKANEVQKYMFEILGFDEFFDYLSNTSEGKELWSQFLINVKQLTGL